MKSKVIATLMLCILLATGCASKNAEATVSEEVFTPVVIQNVEPSTIKNTIIYAGRIEPSSTVSVASKMSGKIKLANFEVGDAVKEGDVLFSLDEQDIENQIRQLESQLNVAEQGVRSAQSGLESATGGQFQTQVLQLEGAVKNSQKQIETAGIALKNAEITLGNAELALQTTTDNLENIITTYNNAKILYEAGTLSKNDYDKAELGYKQATAAVEQAQAGVEQALLGQNQAQVAYEQAQVGLQQSQSSYDLTTGKVAEESVERASIGVNQAQASKQSVQVQLDIARSTLADVNVKSPMSGIISVKNAKASEFTSTQVPAYTIVDMDKVNVEVKVSEVLINKISVGQEVDIYINTISKDVIKGKITTISPAADQTSTFPVKIEIDNAGRIIRPGMFAEVHFIKEQNDSTVVLPRNTVFEDETGQYVYLNNGDTAQKVYITTGIDNGQYIEILTGLSNDDKVIIKGHTYLTDGDKIKVVEE